MTKPISNEVNVVLDKLLNDDCFRAGLLGDPLGTLADIGMHVDPEHIPADRRLPSKEVAAADQQAVLGKLESSLGMVIFMMYGKDRIYNSSK
jgi:putative modified peptide